MFSKEYAAEIGRHYEARRAQWRAAWDAKQTDDAFDVAALETRLLDEKLRETDETLSRCTPDEAEALTFLLGAMPLADFVDYPTSLYLTYAKHAVFLWHDGPFAGRVPERLFTNYVLLHRVNNEDIADVRGLFYDRLKDIAAKDRPMTDVVLDVNYWCAQEGTYRSTDIRTQNPRTMLQTAVGRCGEESTFAATALRSIGIPARQVYAPWWSHCDDNHAWVEVWCDGEWHFFGACEPEEALDRGWFVGPASRAMMVHSRWLSLEEPDGEPAGTKGAVTLLNQLPRYADTARLRVHVQDEAGRAVSGARVRFCVPNESFLGTIAVMRTDENGDVTLTTGRGDLYVSADTGNDRWCETWVCVGEGQERTLVLQPNQPRANDWQDGEFHAPALGRSEKLLTPEQQALGATKLEKAAEQRRDKVGRLTEERALERALGRFAGEARTAAEKLLRGARGNEGELIRFLEWDVSGLAPAHWMPENEWKLKLLQTLREKDTWDVTAEVLIDCASAALPYAGGVADDIFFPYIACPRVMNEFLRPQRAFLAQCLTPEAQAAVRRNPARLCRHMQNWFAPEGVLGYERTYVSPLGALRGGLADEMPQRIFTVSLWRALGIPARISLVDGAPEYYNGTDFTAPGRDTDRDARLTLKTAGALSLADWSHYSLAHFAQGTWERIGLWRYLQEGVGDEITLTLAPGLYRAMTSNRLPSGDQLLSQTTFVLDACEKKTVVLEQREIPTERLIQHMPIEEQHVKTQDGTNTTLSELTDGKRALAAWLAVTREPTEHILNELYERSAEFAALDAPLYVVLREESELNDPTLRRTMGVLPALTPLFSADDSARDALALSVGQEPGKLPLVLITQNGNECLYSDSGYRVGLADMLLKILR